MNSSPRDPGFVAIRCREIPYRPDGPVALLGAFPADAGRWLLDSAHTDARLGRYAFAGLDPFAQIAGFEGAQGPARIDIECQRAAFDSALLRVGRYSVEGAPLDLLGALCPVFDAARIDWPDALPGSLPFVGGAVGGLGYRLGASAQALVLAVPDPLALPDLQLLLVDRLVAWDHVEQRAWAIAQGFGADPRAAARAAESGLAAWSRRVESASAATAADSPHAPAARLDADALRRALLATPVPEGVTASLDRSAYLGCVAALREEIAQGNVYEVNLTRRLTRPFDGDAWRLYRALRACNPAPFACFVEFAGCVVLGSSPERFLRLDAEGAVESRPIKGTRPRGATPAADALLEKALATSEKDRAENLMIVDLVRNDLGRVCAIGSVAVPQLMQVEAYASVFQLVSSVTGQLARDHDRVDLIRAAFPPGSMTGAPKRAAMQLIDRLEPALRGLYSGALGYFDVRGGMDLCVVIRTLLLRGGEVHLDVGGAIVADSEPGAEYDETLDKARALLAALADLEAAGG